MRETDILLNLNELEFDTETELTEEVIRKRWKELSRLYHPDVNDNEIFANSKKQAKINTAKDFLIENLSEVNTYIRMKNHRPNPDDLKREEEERAAKEKAEQERRQRAREEAERKAREEAERKARAAAASSSSSSNSQSSSYGSSSSNSSSRSSGSSYSSTSYSSTSYSSGGSYYSSSASSKSQKKVNKKLLIILGAIFGFMLILSVILTVARSCDSGEIGGGVKISTREDFSKISENPEGKFRLANDIDFESVEWTPVANFNGTFDGDGHTLKNIKISQFDTDYIGLFSTLGEGGEIKNLTIDGLNIDTFRSAKGVGGIVGFCKGTVNGCNVVGTVKTVGVNNVGGIVGLMEYGNKGVSNCSFDGTASGGDGVGGIIGYGSPVTLTGCKVKGEISGHSFVGGVFGGSSTSNARSFTVTNCTNEADVTATGENCGGIIGKIYAGSSWGVPSLEIGGCENSGKIKGTDCTGGIAGYAGVNSSPVVGALSNTADISGADYTGGIVGRTDCGLVLSAVSSVGKIEGKSHVGGILGGGDSAEISNVNNTSEVSGISFVGGIAGLAKKVISCENSAKIYAEGKTDETALGGIVGAADTVKNCKNSYLVEAKFGKGVGGIVGKTASQYFAVEITNCENRGGIRCEIGNSVGGIIGLIAYSGMEYPVDITGCINGGTITVTEDSPQNANIGGIVGRFSAGGFGRMKLTVNSAQCTNTISALKCKNVGGVIGYSEGGSAICSNITIDCEIKGGSAVGAIAGYCTNLKDLESYKSSFEIKNEQAKKLDYIGKKS